MIMVRLIGITIALIISLVVSLSFSIELTTVLATLAFISAIDTSIMRFVAYIYMKTVLTEMNENEKHNSNSDS